MLPENGELLETRVCLPWEPTLYTDMPDTLTLSLEETLKLKKTFPVILENLKNSKITSYVTLNSKLAVTTSDYLSDIVTLMLTYGT